MILLVPTTHSDARPRRLLRKMRLVRKKDFQLVFAQPCRSVDMFFVVLARYNGQTFPRIGMAIARKQVRTAVKRNRIKRLIRESFRLHQELLCGLDVVVIGRNLMHTLDARTLLESLAGHWKILGDRCKQFLSC